MNVLLLSVGTRNGLVHCFRDALSGGAVIAADADGFSPALYAADRRYIVPPITDPDYLDCVLAICEREQVAGVLSLIDPEQSVIAANAERFSRFGVKVIGSSPELCDLAYDKRRMYRWLSERGYRCARFWTDAESFFLSLAAGEIAFPVFIKPVRGSASADAAPADRETAEFWLSRRNDLLIQEYLPGREIGVDAYVDLISGETVSVFAKRKIRMRAGETDKAVSFQDARLFALVERFLSETGFRGPVDLDLFAVDGAYYICDVNPRFGGGYLHAHGCGCDHVRMIVENLRGTVNPKRIGAYESGVCMMKYGSVCLMPETELARRTVAQTEK